MPANNPNNFNAKTIQGPDPTGNQGYPVAVVPAIGADPFPVSMSGGGVVVTDIEDGTGQSIMDAALNAAQVSVINNGTPIIVDTELEAAAALSDVAANPTTPRVGACAMGWNPTAAAMVRVRIPSEVGDAVTNPQALTSGIVMSNTLSFYKMRCSRIFQTLASAVRAGTTSGGDNDNPNCTGILVFMDVTAVPGVSTVTLTVECRDSAGAYRVIATDAAVAVTGVRGLAIGWGASAVPAGTVINAAFPWSVTFRYRVTVVHTGAGNFTYSVRIQECI